MNELRTLLKLELRSLYGINKYRHTKDPKEKRRLRWLALAWGILLAVVFTYVGGLVYGLCYLGLGDIVPAYLVVIASIVILSFGAFTAGYRIFGQKGYDLLAAMPIRPQRIVASRFFSLYAEDLVLTAAVLLPGLVTYGICRRPGIGFYLAAILGGLFLPAIPLVISTLLGTVIGAISARMQKKGMAQTALMLGLAILVLLGSFRMGNAAGSLTPEAFADLAKTVGALLGRLYPPALWLSGAMLGENPWGLALYLLVSAGVMGLALFLAGRCFHSLLGRLQSLSARHDYKLGTLESRRLLMALWLREAKRYFSSSIYVTNTIIGPILTAIMAVALCFVDLSAVQRQFPFAISGLLPFFFSGVFCMMTTTSTAISMEGKQFWVVKSLPIPTKALLDSKLLLNLSLMAPFYLISLVALVIALKPGPWALFWLAVIPGAVILFSVVMGITVNLRFHSFDWAKEETVVKQSLSAALGGFAGFFLSVLLGLVLPRIPEGFANPAKALAVLVILGVTWLLYQKNNKADLSKL